MLVQQLERRGCIALAPALGGEQLPGVAFRTAHRACAIGKGPAGRFVYQQGDGGHWLGACARGNGNLLVCQHALADDLHHLAIDLHGAVFDVALGLAARAIEQLRHALGQALAFGLGHRRTHGSRCAAHGGRPVRARWHGARFGRLGRLERCGPLGGLGRFR